MSQRTAFRNMALAGAASVPLVLAGCLSSSSSSGDDSEAEHHELAADVSGLGPGTLMLDLDGETHEIEEDGTVVLSDEMPEGDEFSLSVAEQPSEPLQDCEPDQSEGEVEGDLTIAVNCLTPVTVEGQVAGEDPGGRSVILSDGDESWETEASEDGGFEVEAAPEDPWAVMYLEAAGEPDHFRSYLGSPVGLYQDRGIPIEDQVNFLDESVTGRVNLNHLNTAMAGALRYMHDGEAFESHDEIEQASRELLTEESAEVAGGFVMVSDGEASLPAAGDDYFAVALDFTAAREWAEDLANDDGSSVQYADGDAEVPEADRPRVREPMISRDTTPDPATGLVPADADDFNSAIAQALEEAAVEDADFDDLPDTFFIIGGFEWGLFPYAAKVDTVGATAWLRDRGGSSGPGAFTVDDGDLVINLEEDDTPHRVQQERVWCYDDDDDPVRCDHLIYLDEMTVSQVLDGFGSNMVLQEIEGRRVEEEIDGDWSDETSFSWDRFVSMMAPGDNVALDQDELNELLALDLPGEQWQPEDIHEHASTNYSDVLELPEGDAGEMRHHGMPFEWEITEEGALRFRDISSGAVEDYHAWMISGDEDGTGFMLVEPVHDESWSVQAGVAVAKDPDFFFSSSDLEGRWEQWGEHRDNSFFLDYSGSGGTAYLGPEEDADWIDSPYLDERPYKFEMVSAGDDPVFRMAAVTYWDEDGDFIWEEAPEFHRDDLDPSDYEDASSVRFEKRYFQVIEEEEDWLFVVHNREHYVDRFPDGDEWNWEPMLATNDGTVRYFIRRGDHEIN